MQVSSAPERQSLYQTATELESQQRILAEQVAMLCRLSRSSILGGFLAAPFVCWLVLKESPWSSILIWLGAIFSVSFARLWLQNKFLNGTLRVESRTLNWLFLGVAVNGFMWSLPSTWLLPSQPASQVILGVFIVGLSSVSLISLAPVRNAYPCFLITIMLPIAVLYLFMGAEYAQSAVGIIAYVIFMIGAGHRYTKNIQDMLRLQFDNGALAVRIQREKEIVERANLDLQQQIAQRERTEVQLRHAKTDAEAANRAKSQFLANMSHELRTPLNGILGMSELLLRSLTSPHLAHGPQTLHKQIKHTQLIRNAGERLLHLISDILDMARVEAGMLRLENALFSPRQLIDDVVDLVEEQYASKGIALAVNIASDIPFEVRGDSHRVRQILTNLITNALKFTERGSVVVSLECVRATPNSLDEAQTLSLRWSVRDTGIGIAENSRQQLFQPFSQVDDSATRRFGGTGLGLAICYQLVTALKGRVDFESELGRGSTFWFELPLELVAESPPTPSISSVHSNAIQGHVLVVEDNNTNRLLVIEMLQLVGCQVSSATNGAEALQKLAQERFDVVIMDWHMPEMDGVSATRAFREFESKSGAKRTPVVALTASVLAGDRETCLQAGMDDFIPKPFTYDELVAGVQRWLTARM